MFSGFSPFHFFPFLTNLCIPPSYFGTFIRFTNHLHIFSYFASWVATDLCHGQSNRASWNSAQKIPPWHTFYFRMKCHVHNIQVVNMASIPVMWSNSFLLGHLEKIWNHYKLRTYYVTMLRYEVEKIFSSAMFYYQRNQLNKPILPCAEEGRRH